MKIISFLDQHPGLYYIIAIILLTGIFPSFWKFGKKLILYFCCISKSPIELTFYNKARNKETEKYYFITPIITIFNKHPFKKTSIAGIKIRNLLPNPFEKEISQLTSGCFIVTDENTKELQFLFFLETRKKYFVKFDPNISTFRDGWQISKHTDTLPKKKILVELFYTTGDKLSYRLSDIEVKY